MKLVDIIVIAILVILIGGAVAYIIKAKKSGQKCIGCPYSGQCPSQKKICNDCQKNYNKNICNNNNTDDSNETK